ncbi:riboflavin biosynthesis RibT protein [Pelagirhabdus alkalitolerans]|uniref:Riboflavin biosynthesis RibT protein n=1 Tax=Pelagirhabdus alkalitolerans TaxID=1612202 RepID=A0A1G6HBW5_9BACI|nr:GNAT family N-acetyltransferase [Pelagirhabdus alkalitolerans]SDB91691.1 riboflavin biosynthesis RibT protein [Pelagirhabdus alkalitolerans]
MLIRFKKSMEKIAMGLLSFMPEEKDVKKLQQTMQQYEEDPNWQLYLWKVEEDVLAAIGVEINPDEKTVIVQHITVNPSHRDMGIGRKMIEEIRSLYEDEYRVVPNDLTDSFLNKCD